MKDHLMRDHPSVRGASLLKTYLIQKVEEIHIITEGFGLKMPGCLSIVSNLEK